MLPFGLSAGMSLSDAVIQKKVHESVIAALMTSKKEMEDLMEIVKTLEESGLLVK